MLSLRGRLIRYLIVDHYLKKVFNLEGQPVEQMRRKFNNMSKRARLPKGTAVEKTTVAGLPAEWVKTVNVPEEDQKIILHFHGGGVCGSCETHRYVAALISMACGVRVLLADYRLAPEYKYPAANDDCLSAYRWLLENVTSPTNIIIGGDSFGAGLALMTLLSLRDAGVRLPAAAYLFSPWDFIRFDGESYTSRAKLDYLNMGSFQICARYYLDSSAQKPLSLFDRDMTGLPDLLIQVGDHEIILSDSIRIAENAKKAGVKAELEVYDNMWHGFQGLARVVPEAKQALLNFSKFIKRNFNEN